MSQIYRKINRQRIILIVHCLSFTRKAIFDAMNKLEVVISFAFELELIISKLLIVWELNVLGLIPKFDCKGALYFLESSNDIVCQAFVIFVDRVRSRRRR